MPEILHRVTIDAAVERVHDLISSSEGIACWWTGRQLEGVTEIGGRFSVYFADAESPAAVMEVVSDTPAEISWRVVEGPDQWIGTLITFGLRSRDDNGTTLLFTHSGWRDVSEFMSGCSTNWGAYLTSLKLGAETGRFAAFPQGEISRWS